MKNNQKRKSSIPSGILLAVLTFLLLSVFNSGALEFSKEAGMIPWLMDTAVYALGYKLSYKLVASLCMFLLGWFIGSMVAYGKEIKTKMRSRATHVEFQKGNTRVSRTA